MSTTLRVGYLHRISEAIRDIERAIQEIGTQEEQGDNFGDGYRATLRLARANLTLIATQLREATEAEAALVP